MNDVEVAEVEYAAAMEELAASQRRLRAAQAAATDANERLLEASREAEMAAAVTVSDRLAAVLRREFKFAYEVGSSGMEWINTGREVVHVQTLAAMLADAAGGGTGEVASLGVREGESDE